MASLELVELAAFGFHQARQEAIQVMNYETRQAAAARDYDSAIGWQKAILLISPNNARAMNRIAGFYGQNKNYEMEILWAKKAIALWPKYNLAKENFISGIPGQLNIKHLSH